MEEARQNQGLVTHRGFVELVGRLVYAGQVLVWLKPLIYMAPLHAWKSAISPRTVATLAQTVMVVLLFIAEMLQKGYHRTSGRSSLKGQGQPFRTDAECDETKIVLGGWELDETGRPKEARWFAVEVKREEAPWLFETDHLPSRSTVAELLSSLVALEVFGYFERGQGPRHLVLEAGTDNLATEHISKKGSSNKFLLAYVQMQLGLKCYLCGLVFKLQWRPREVNVEADDLTNWKFDKFTASKRCHVDWKKLDWAMMEKLCNSEGRSEVGVRRGTKHLRCRPGRRKDRRWRLRQSGDSAEGGVMDFLLHHFGTYVVL